MTNPVEAEREEAIAIQCPYIRIIIILSYCINDDANEY